MLQDSLYHSLLRIASLSFALILLFESGIVSPVTKELADNARLYVASAIGMTATVSPNELNTITAELSQQRQSLEEREAALREREIAVNLNSSAAGSTTTTWILSAILFILLVLIVLNYVLDFLRRQPMGEPKNGQYA